ncbi:MAG: Gfo/Idh/MocA family oxidoreductase [Bacteroidetes bacterium]|nr:Gfo/Idh/MocA family oxidoreductase [Bacteroidota bacterium]
MKRYRVLLIGAGQLGSRHLQGLAKSTLALDIDIVDISPESLEVAKQRFFEVSPVNVTIGEMKTALKELPAKNYDLAILATNADIRELITKQLLYCHNVSNIIFEKVAFQSVEQFKRVFELLNDKGVKSWVNCARRYFVGYKKLAQELKNKGPLDFKLIGTEWGLACNSVHYIDLFFFLSGDSEYVITEDSIENKIYDSKRKGFVEFYGYFIGMSKNGSAFKIECNHLDSNQEMRPTSIEIIQASKSYRIEESKNIISVFDKDNNSLVKEFEVGIIYQSSLTGFQAEDIILNNKSNLPTIEESYNAHKPFLNMLKSKYESITCKLMETIPIT